MTTRPVAGNYSSDALAVYDGDTWWTSDYLNSYGLKDPIEVYIPDTSDFSMSQFKKYYSWTSDYTWGYIYYGGTYSAVHYLGGGYYGGYIKGGYEISSYTPASYSKGSTNYGQVTSTNRNAYPDNNYSGSYWYVYYGEV